jgi:hypothetical protein
MITVRASSVMQMVNKYGRKVFTIEGKEVEARPVLINQMMPDIF